MQELQQIQLLFPSGQTVTDWPSLREDGKSARYLHLAKYQELLAGGSREQALRMARLQMLARPSTAHPYFWGAFTLLGDGR